MEQVTYSITSYFINYINIYSKMRRREVNICEIYYY